MASTHADNESPPEVPASIPSAVAGEKPWNLGLVAGCVLLGLMVVLVAHRSRRSDPVPAVDLPFEPSRPLTSAPWHTTSPTPIQSRLYDGAVDESLREVRRRSPVLIYNNTAPPNPTATGPASTDTGLPMPLGFHPASTATGAHSNALGEREFVITQGKLIDAILESAIETDHPGMLRALVSNNIYGDTGRTVLLPRGSRLIGQYDSDMSQGQSRIFVIWQRVVRPDGVELQLDSGGTDALGRAGVAGRVNHHFFTMFGAATLLSILGATSAAVGVNSRDADNSLSTYRSSVSQGFNEAASNVLGVFVRIKPTASVKQGSAIKVFVARDLYFNPATFAAGQTQVIP